MDTTDAQPPEEPQEARRGIARPPRVRRTASEPGNGSAPAETVTENPGQEAELTSTESAANGTAHPAPSMSDIPADPTERIPADVTQRPPSRRGPRPRPANNGDGARRRPDRDRPQRPDRQRGLPPRDDGGPESIQREYSGEPLPSELANVTIPHLEGLDREAAAQLAEILGMSGGSIFRREDMVHRAIQTLGERGGIINASGILETTNDGYGFIRHRNLHHNINDVYVAQSQVRRFGLRTGDWVTGPVRSPKSGEKYYGLLRVDTVTGQEPEVSRRRPIFDQLTALFPDRLYDLETDQKAMATRLLNLIAPIGFGQRALIVSPPKAGKTILLHQIADALSTRYPETHIMAALIGERPEEVTDWERTVKGAEVMSSTFDEPVEEHTRVAEIVLARAKRLVEAGRDVVILLDSITRLARAYNIAAPSSGRTLSGGLDPVALYPPKHFFGAARNTEEAGTLTIVATCLVDTGSRLDDVIYEEFKGTGNMEVHLERRLAERRIYPAIDVIKSSTRRDERLYDEQTYRGIVTLRRMMAMLSNSNMDASDATERILDRISRTKTNAEFIATLSREM